MADETEGQWDQAGWATYSAIMLFSGGLIGLVNGVWAIRYEKTEADLVLAETNLTAWGMVALIGGVLMLAAGIGVFYGRKWARWTGIVLAASAILWSVGWAEVQPTQSLIGALLGATVVFGLTTTPVTVTTDS